MRSRTYYTLATERVAELLALLREVIAEHIGDIDRLAAAYFGNRHELETMTRDQLKQRLRRGAGLPVETPYGAYRDSGTG